MGLGNVTNHAQVNAIAWDSTNKKITKTIGTTTSDVVTASTLKTAMSLNNVTNVATESTITSGSSKNITSGAVYGHTSNKNNPHGVTKSQVGLGNVNNVAALPLTGGTVTGGTTFNGTITLKKGLYDFRYFDNGVNDSGIINAFYNELIDGESKPVCFNSGIYGQGALYIWRFDNNTGVAIWISFNGTFYIYKRTNGVWTYQSK